LREILEKRERAFPSAIGHGVSIPNTYLSDLNDRLCLLARLKTGLEFDGGEPIHLVFLVLSPRGDAEGHLETIAEVARFNHLEFNRQSVMEAETGEGAREYIRKVLKE
jgi:mannitol/fructose-specific phosphotransferase system IIA component (Ntr-type)